MAKRWGQTANPVEIHTGYSRLFIQQLLFSKHKTTLMFKNMHVRHINLQHAKALSFLLALRQAKLQNSLYILLIQEARDQLYKFWGNGSRSFRKKD